MGVYWTCNLKLLMNNMAYKAPFSMMELLK